MSDAPRAVPMHVGPWEPTDEQIARAAERARLQAQRNAEDAARAAAGTSKMVAVTGFTLVTDANPAGQQIAPGQEIEISDYDAHKYAGKCVRA